MQATRKNPPDNRVACAICKTSFDRGQTRPWSLVRPGVSKLICTEHPDWADGKYICRQDLATYRRRHLELLMEQERGELSALDQQVIASLEHGQIISQDPEELLSEKETFGERMADHVATFGGSWTFILSFCAVLVIWMVLNVTAMFFKTFDPYPFILLNLVLSCLAALQAPIIMMSQRRQESKDRLRGENDYKVNLKAELEIRQLHEKIDHHLANQWERLAEMQQIQIEMLEEKSGS